MIVFNVAIVGYWVAHGNRYQHSGEVGSCSKGSILLSLGFLNCFGKEDVGSPRGRNDDHQLGMKRNRAS